MRIYCGFGLEKRDNFVKISPIFVQYERKIVDFPPKSPIFVLKSKIELTFLMDF